MSYVDDNLSGNEKVLFRARVSNAVFLRSIFMAVITITVFMIGFFSSSGKNGLLILFSMFLALWATLLLIQAFIILATTEFAVTDRRVIAKTGFIRRHTVEMLLLKVESVSVNQSILGRIFNFGTVVITGTGGTREGFRVIAEPLKVRKKVNEILETHLRANAAYQQSKAAEQNQG